MAVEAQVRARRMRGSTTGREHLDAFADYVSHYAERPGANLPGLLAQGAAEVLVLDDGSRDGTAETFGDIVRRDPLRFALIVLAIVFLLGLMAAPGYLLSR